MLREVDSDFICGLNLITQTLVPTLKSDLVLNINDKPPKKPCLSSG